MERNDLNYPKPSEEQSPQEQAFSIFVERAICENRNYFSDIVKENLNKSLSGGATPQEAVDDLFKRLNNRKIGRS